MYELNIHKNSTILLFYLFIALIMHVLYCPHGNTHPTFYNIFFCYIKYPFFILSVCLYENIDESHMGAVKVSYTFEIRTELIYKLDIYCIKYHFIK